MKNIVFLLVLILAIACKKDDGFGGKACFSIENEGDIYMSTVVRFLNCTEGDYYYLWQFGDGKYAYDKEPKHLYNSTGSFEITLVIQDEEFKDTNDDGLVTMEDRTGNSNYKKMTIQVY